MGEYGYDYDTGNIVYHYGDGIATDDAGKEYMEIDGDHMVDLKTDEIQYAPYEHDFTTNYSNDISLWFYVGVGSVLFCVVYTYMIFSTAPKYFLHAVATGLFAYYSFLQAKT